MCMSGGLQPEVSGPEAYRDEGASPDTEVSGPDS